MICYNKPMNTAVIFAGGVGKRMRNNGAPKQFLDLHGSPIIAHTLRFFQDSPLIDHIIIVMLEEYIPFTQKIVDSNQFSKVAKIVPGGDSGQASIFNGLNAAKELFGLDNHIVLIHDGVRPFIEKDLIERCIKSVEQYGSAISSVPATETIVGVENGDITRVTDRTNTYLARAPQCFYLSDIYSWHQTAKEEGNNSVIDSCSMMLKYSDKKPHIVETCPENLKVTTPLDYYIMKAIIEAEDSLSAPDVNIEDYNL